MTQVLAATFLALWVVISIVVWFKIRRGEGTLGAITAALTGGILASVLSVLGALVAGLVATALGVPLP